MHLGEGDWMIVDSCEQSRQSPVLDYLHNMGVDPATAVKLVVATHWHDDHIRGMQKVLAACKAATFACSAALSRDELVQAIGRLEPARGGRLTSGVKEMRSVLEMLTEDLTRPQPQWAMQDRLLHRRGGALHCAVHALAPCDQVLARAVPRKVLPESLRVRHGHDDAGSAIGPEGERRFFAGRPEPTPRLLNPGDR